MALASNGSELDYSMPKTTGRASRRQNAGDARYPSASGPQILTFALQHRPRATRASVPKVRTGCITCKKRHVKCDEARPSCQRCVKWQGFCEGYERGKSASGASTTGSEAGARRSTTPASSPESASSAGLEQSSSPSSSSSQAAASGMAVAEKGARSRAARGRSSATPFTVEPDFNSSVFGYQWEKVYFDHWLGLAKNLGGGFFPSQIWTKTIPQLSVGEPALRYALMAVGAMANVTSPSAISRGSSICSGMVPAGSKGPHYQNALTYYGRALHLVRTQKPSSSDSALRAATLSCILFVCFETLHGNQAAALGHIRHGMQMMESFVGKSAAAHADPSCASCGGGGGGGGEGRPPEAPNAQDGCLHSPRPHVIDDEIVQIFHRLDFQSWSTGILQPKRTGAGTYPSHLDPAQCLRPPDGGAPDLWRRVPARFGTLADAHRWWDLVQHWVLQFPRTAVARLAEVVAAAGGEAAEAARGLDLCDAPGVRGLQRQTLELLERWGAAFAPLYAAARQDKRGAAREGAYLQAVSLQIQYLISWVGVRSISYSEYETMYQLTPQFRELVRLSAILLPRQHRHQQQRSPPAGPGPGAEIFTLDNGPTMALFVTATKCRDADLREEAMALMEQYPRRDGFWDTRPLVAVGRLNRAIEAENEAEGDLREQWARLRLREVRYGDGVRSLVVFYYRKDAQTGRWERRVSHLSW